MDTFLAFDRKVWVDGGVCVKMYRSHLSVVLSMLSGRSLHPERKNYLEFLIGQLFLLVRDDLNFGKNDGPNGFTASILSPV